MRWYIEKIYGWDYETQRRKTLEELSRLSGKMRIITAGDKDIGVTTFYEENGVYVVGLIIIQPEYQNKGIASSIIGGYIDTARAEGKKITVKTYAGNPARRLYERLGFRLTGVIGTHAHYEIDPGREDERRMDIQTVEIYGKNRFETFTGTRVACRGILFSGDRILLTHENNGQYFIPGGGMEEEDGGSLEKCCARELAEETGILAVPKLCFLRLNEYYEDWKYISFYFICEYVGRTERKLTEQEKEAGIEPVWVDIGEALEIFSHHADYDAEAVLSDSDEMKRGAYLREYTALRRITAAPELMERARPCFSSEHAVVRYLAQYNVVLVVWKSFCSLDEYRAPLEYALGIIKRYGCDYAADTRSGFENIPEDTRWVAEHFMPKAAEYGCRTIYFIIDKENSLKEELEGQQSDSEDIMRFEYIYDISEAGGKANRS